VPFDVVPVEVTAELTPIYDDLSELISAKPAASSWCNSAPITPR